MILTALIVYSALVSLLSVVLAFILRGMLISAEEDSSVVATDLSGREVEKIKRRLTTVGVRDISYGDIANLVKTINSIQLGTYEDTDVYIPADSYDDI